jgi:hypothetical protein
MYELTFTRSARGVAAVAAALGLTIGGIVAEAHLTDRGAVDVRTEAPSMLGVADSQARAGDLVTSQARAKLADLRAQRDADAACSMMAYPQRAC